jgi:Tol biopolymer transport system component
MKSALIALSLASAAPAPLGTVTPWAPDAISSAMFESHPAFDPRNNDLYFVRSSPDFSGWRIKLARCGKHGLATPVDAPFAGDGVEADPWFTPDGRSLYFISSRTSDGVTRKDLDIWRVDRDASGKWGTPVRLPEPVNSTAQEWFPRLAKDGWLYFGSGRPGELGKTDIWRARQDRAGAWRVENLGPSVNTAGDEYEPLPSPDGRSMIVEATGGYFETKRVGDGWAPRVRLGPEINVNGTEIGAAYSPSGRSLMFARDAGGGRSGEIYLWRRARTDDWPLPCSPPDINR